MSDAISDAVQTQYEAFPYPVWPAEEKLTDASAALNYSLAQYARTRLFQSSTGKRVLIAGCGTGFDLVSTALINPDLKEIIGVDLSRQSIQLAQAKVADYQIKNCHLCQANLLEPETLPTGPFDFIVSYGVIHHTADPAKALRHLAERLAPEGVMSIMLSNRSGRHMIYRIRQALDLLKVKASPQGESITFVQDLLEAGQPNTALAAHTQHPMAKHYYEQPENIVDNFLHAQDIPFDIAEIPPFLAQAGLEFIDIARESFQLWNPELVISPLHQQFYERYNRLSRIQQLSVLEHLHPGGYSKNTFWCCKQGQITYPDGFNPTFFSESQWRLNPQCLHSSLRIGSQVHPLSSVLANPDLIMADVPLKLEWQLVPTPQHEIVLSRFQIRHLLLPLTQQPQSGAAILDQCDPSLRSHILDLFKTWEATRIVLRT